jgi:hypothetical protein
VFAIRRSLLVALSVIASLVGACGGDAAAPSGPKPGLAVLPYAYLVDTAGAQPAAPLVAEYRSADGSPMPGVEISFEVLDVKWSGFAFSPVLFVSRGFDGATSYTSRVIVKTDAQGRAEAPLIFGTIAGSGTVRVNAPGPGGTETMMFAVTPGTVARILFSVGDTVITIGSSVAISAAAADRWGNPRAEAVSLSLRRGDATASLTNGTLRGLAFGQAIVEGSLPGTTDSLSVGIVPLARLAIVEPVSSGGATLSLIDSDMSGRRLLLAASSSDGWERLPAWAPTGERLIVQMGSIIRLFFVDTATRTVTRAIPFVTEAREEYLPTYSPDGQWIYYSAVSTYQDEKLWRASVDGTSAMRIGLPGGDYFIDSSPSVSPDGSRVVYWTSRTSGSRDVPMLMTLRVGTTDTTGLNATGYFPKWSPTGTDILYRHEDTLKLVRPDGTNLRVIGLPSGGYGGHPVWSPDGQFVIAEHVQGVQMIRAATGEIVQYPSSTTSWGQIVWRP